MNPVKFDARIGERLYTFYSQTDLALAREIYVKCVKNQDGFETEMENQNIDFCYSMEDLF